MQLNRPQRVAIEVSLSLAVAALCFALAATARGGPFDGPLAKQVAAPFVAITVPGDEGPRAVGAGTVIELNGEKLILTAAHVVQSKRGYAPTVGDLRTYVTEAEPRRAREARIVAYSAPEDEKERPGDDLALLRPLDPSGLIAAHRPASALQLIRGEPLWYIGSPRGEIGHMELSIYSREREWAGKPFYVTNGVATFGNSGGGCYVLRGETYYLVGVLTRTIGTFEKPPALCETQDTIARFLAGHKLPAK